MTRPIYSFAIIMLFLIGSVGATPYVVVSMSEFEVITTDEQFTKEFTIRSTNRSKDASDTDYGGGILSDINYPMNIFGNELFYEDAAKNDIIKFDLNNNQTTTILESYQDHVRENGTIYEIHSLMENGIFYHNQDINQNLSSATVNELSTIKVIDYVIVNYEDGKSSGDVDLQRIIDNANLTISQEELNSFHVVIYLDRLSLRGDILTGTLGITDYKKGESGGNGRDIIFRYDLSSDSLKTVKLEEDGIYYGEELPSTCNFQGQTIYNYEIDSSLHFSGHAYCEIDWSSDNIKVKYANKSLTDFGHPFYFEANNIYFASHEGFKIVNISNNETTFEFISPDFSYFSSVLPMHFKDRFFLVNGEFQAKTEGTSFISGLLFIGSIISFLMIMVMYRIKKF